MAIIILATSLILLPISVALVKLDLNEQSESNIITSIEDEIAERCQEIIQIYGVRQICRKVIASSILRRTEIEITLEDKIRAVESVLELSPSEPSYWIALAKLQLLNFSDPQTIVNSLRLSYVTGRSVQSLSEVRFSVALSLWDQLDRSDKYIALNDLKIANSKQIQNMTDSILRSDQSTASEILQFLIVLDHLLAEYLRHELRATKK